MKKLFSFFMCFSVIPFFTHPNISKVLIMGQGDHEHALAWKIAQSPTITHVYVASGNAGTTLEQKVHSYAIAETDVASLIRFARMHDIDLIIPGTELAVAAAITDACNDAGIACFGPTQAAAQLETSNIGYGAVVREKSKSIATSYDNAGVSIESGNQFVHTIKSLVRTTARPGAAAEIGGFSGIFDPAALSYRDPLLVGTTDGVGTKLKLAQRVGIHHTIGIDLVAMNVNDLLVMGAEPLFFLDYIATGKLDVIQAQEIIRGIVDGCKQSNCALIGGETAEMPLIYDADEYDLAGFAVGIVERTYLLPQLNAIQSGDVVIGVRSSGLHSNGFSLVQYLIEKHQIDIYATPPFSSDKAYLYEELLIPTLIYTTALLPLCQQNCIKAAAHITGGGFFDNIPRVLLPDKKVVINRNLWQPDPVFLWLAEIGSIDDYEMFHTFNMGIGMILIAEPSNAEYIIAMVQKDNLDASIIGHVETCYTNQPQVEII